MWRRRTRFWIGLRKAQSKQGRNKFFDTGWGETWGPACERVSADGRTDSLCAILLDHPAILWTRGNCYLWGSGGRGGDRLPLSRHEKTRCPDKITCVVDEGSASTIVVSGRIGIQFEYFKGTRAKKSWQDKESCEVEKGLDRCVKGFFRNLLWNSSHNKYIVDSLCNVIFFNE